MKQCETCGCEVEDGAAFCPQCGAQLGKAAGNPDTESIEGAATLPGTEPKAKGDTSGKTEETSLSKAGSGATQPAEESPSTQHVPGKDATDAQKEAALAKPTGNSGTKQAPAGAAAEGTQKLLAFAKKNKKPLAIAGGVVVLAIIAIIVFVTLLGGISTDRLKQDLVANGAGVTKGSVPDNYVNESAYEIKDIKITGQADESGTVFGQNITAKTVAFTIVTESENFHTEAVGEAYYMKEGNDWLYVSSAEKSSTTEPLKGVDLITPKANTSSSTTNPYTVSDFNSTFDSDGGVYTSTATQTVEYEYWFANDSAKNKLTFTFDSQQGWQPQGQIQVTDEHTDWKLSDKTFTMEPVTSAYSATTLKNTTASLTFGENKEGSLTASYKIAFTAPESTSKYETVSNVDLAGTASGTPSHNFGNESFTIELNDPENSVTLSCSTSGASLVAGEGTRNALSVSVDTKTTWREWSGFGAGTADYAFSKATFTESTAA